MKTFLHLIALVGVITGATAHAAFVSDRLGAIQPFTGMYYDPAQSGSGLSVDVGPGGSMFLQFATYDQATGSQVNYITQPNYAPSSESIRASTGVIGASVGGQFYQVTNGQCPGCAYRPPTVTALPIIPSFVWTSPRHVTMTFATSGNTYTYHFDAANYEGKDDEEFLQGTWAVSMVNDYKWVPGIFPKFTVILPADLAILRVVPAPFSTLTLASGSAADVTLPPAGAHLYIAQCAGSPEGADPAACNQMERLLSEQDGFNAGIDEPVLWYDQATKTAGLELYHFAAGGVAVIGPSNFHSPLYITPNALQVHLQLQGTTGQAGRTPGDVSESLTFTRLPSLSVRDCSDYVATNCN